MYMVYVICMSGRTWLFLVRVTSALDRLQLTKRKNLSHEQDQYLQGCLLQV